LQSGRVQTAFPEEYYRRHTPTVDFKEFAKPISGSLPKEFMKFFLSINPLETRHSEARQTGMHSALWTGRNAF